MKNLLKIFLSLYLVLFLPFHVFGQSCAQSDNSSVGATTASTDLDNSTHNNCVAGDVAAWAMDKVYIYTDVYCTEGRQEINFSNGLIPTESGKIDFANAPNMGSASVLDGTYNCVAGRMWDNITFSPYKDTTSGSCVAADNYTQDLCGAGTSYYDPDNQSFVECADSSGSDGTVGDGNEWIWIYMSTASTKCSWA